MEQLSAKRNEYSESLQESKQLSQSCEEMESSQEKEQIDPWSRIQDNAFSRHVAKLNALINKYEQNGDSHNVA